MKSETLITTASGINDVHGGDLESAARMYDVPLEQWLDLSTGIAPWPYPDVSVPARVWQRLPHGDNALLAAASAYYGCTAECMVPVAGSQQAIALIPQLLDAPCRVAIPRLGYFEHRKAWQAAGHQLIDYDDHELPALIEQALVDAAVVINPNNPTGHMFERQRLLELCEQLHGRGGLMLVDEAFADTFPEVSLAAYSPQQGLLVLRSVGKFFGMAGLRLGFVLGEDDWCQRLGESLNCWNVNGPAQWVGTRFLSDKPWHLAQRQRIKERCNQLQYELKQALGGQAEIASAQLFVRAYCSAGFGERLYEGLAKRGILIRRFQMTSGVYCLRFGLPESDTELQRLLSALKEINDESART